VVSNTPRPFYPRERPGTHCTGGWAGPRAGLDVSEISRPQREFYFILLTTLLRYNICLITYMSIVRGSQFPHVQFTRYSLNRCCSHKRFPLRSDSHSTCQKNSPRRLLLSQPPICPQLTETLYVYIHPQYTARLEPRTVQPVVSRYTD
jgi:hypothetical protein